MGVVPPPAELEVLDRETCLRLLGTAPVGRVAVAVPGEAPLVVPVNFLLVDERIVFRTDYGTVFRQAVLAEGPVSFEVDAFDVTTRTGWSVVVQGPANEVGEWEASGLTLRPWAPGSKEHWVQLEARSVTGRRLVLPELPGWPDQGGYL
jgi:nitroimidazol reductase NimA-like FMN-containing flavoprotein (pyridoxamine 5'-phosphate oxidase superfamily)